MSEFLGYLCLIVILALGFLFATNQKIELKPNVPVTTQKGKLPLYKVYFYSGGKLIKTWLTSDYNEPPNKVTFVSKGKTYTVGGDYVIEKIK